MGQGAKIQLFSDDGQRLYLTPEERDKFRLFAKKQDRLTRSYCLMLRETGMRPQEALNTLVSSIDFSTKSVIVESLKKRKSGIYRQIPLSDEFLDELNLVHELKTKQKTKAGRSEHLWNWSIRTARRRVKQVMENAGIEGGMAMPKGLRHGFGVVCVMQGIPLPTLQKWLGHASIETTAIYTQIIGKEERELASRLWG